jgi:hypothetical protein
MSQLRRYFGHIGYLQIAIIFLILLTAVIHLQHGLAMGSGGAMGGGSGMRTGTGFTGTPGAGFGNGGPSSQGTAGAQGTPGTRGTIAALGTPGTRGTMTAQGTTGTQNGNGQGGYFGGTNGQGGPGGTTGGSSGGSVLSWLPISMEWLMILNFLGYLVLGVALYAPLLRKIQRLVRWLLLGYTALTIVAYFLIAGTMPNTLGISDKIIEGALIVALLLEEWLTIRRKRRGQPHDEPVAGTPDLTQQATLVFPEQFK